MNSPTTSAETSANEGPSAIMQAHIARQPIVDRKQQIVGYELFAREGGNWPRFHAAVAQLAKLPKPERLAKLRALEEQAGQAAQGDAVEPKAR